MVRKSNVPDAALDAALELAGTVGWRDLSMRDIAETSGATLEQLYGVYPTKLAILKAFSARIDAAVLAGDSVDLAAESARDRLFDVMMRRFEALAGHKKAACSIARTSMERPSSTLAGFCLTRTSMRWMLEAAGIDTGGVVGVLRVKGLALVWLDVFRIWQADDSEDMARTMAHLDRRLAMVERLLQLLHRAGSPEPETSEASP